MTGRGTTDRAEVVMAGLLRAGVLTAAVIVLAGGAAFLAERGSAPARDYAVFRGEPAALRSVSAIVEGAMALEYQSVIMLGLLVLIATPIVRVVFSVVMFALERDRTFVVITLLVLAILAFSLFGQRQ